MIGLLLLTLFPIAWMIYSSFKENTDILVGKVSLSRAKNTSMAIGADHEYVYVCTADGGINKFERNTGKLKDHTSARTSATNFVLDMDHIWVSSANRGITRFNKNDFSKKAEYQLPLEGYDQSKIANTIIIKEGNTIWFSMRYKGYEGIIEFDTIKGKVTRTFDLANKYSPVQITSLKKVGDIFWVGSDKALLKVNVKDGKVVREFSSASILPNGITEIVPFQGRLLLAGSTGLYDFSPWYFNIIRHYDKESGLISSQIESIAVKGNFIFLGTNAGLSILDGSSGETRNFSQLFNPLTGRGKVIEGKFTVGGITSLKIEENGAFVGSTAGRISRLDTYIEKVSQTYVAGKGHLVIAWRNFIDMWKNINFGLFLRNSFIICGLTMFFAMVFATLAAYAISRFKFPGSSLFSMAILATQMVPGIMFLIPIYIMFIKFTEFTGIPMKGTFFGMIFIYTAFFVPFSIWILRGFFAAIPHELEEAARIDGCSPLQVFWYIVLPLAIPGIIATGIYVFLTAWDELMFAWILTSADTMTIPVGIRNFVGNYQNRFDLLMAASTVATIPVMVLFFMLQKHIVRGLTAGAVKG